MGAYSLRRRLGNVCSITVLEIRSPPSGGKEATLRVFSACALRPVGYSQVELFEVLKFVRVYHVLCEATRLCVPGEVLVPPTRGTIGNPHSTRTQTTTGEHRQLSHIAFT